MPGTQRLMYDPTAYLPSALPSGATLAYCNREFPMRKILVAALVALATLAACGVPARGGTATQPAAASPTVAVPTIPNPTPPLTAPPSATQMPTLVATAAPTTAPTNIPSAQPSPVAPKPGSGGTSVRPPDALVQTAQQALAAYLQRPASDIELQSANYQEWPDGALGCPAEGMAYPQIVTPGFLLVFTTDNQAQRYEIHTGRGSSQLVLCSAGKPVNLAPNVVPPGGNSGDLDTQGRTMLGMARAALAQELGVDASAISLVSAEPIDWNDSSLGCARPGQAAMQVITPGYKFVFAAGGQQYEYHTDARARVLRCDGK